MRVTTEECEARIWNDAKLMAEALNDNDFAGFLTCSYSPMKSDTLEFGERVKSFIEAAVTARADWMAREMNAEQAEYEADAAHESRLIDEGNKIAVNAGRY